MKGNEVSSRRVLMLTTVQDDVLAPTLSPMSVRRLWRTCMFVRSYTKTFLVKCLLHIRKIKRKKNGSGDCMDG